MTEYRKEGNFEKPGKTLNGIAMLLLLIALAVVEALGIAGARGAFVVPAVVIGIAIAFIAGGFFMLQPNEAVVLTLFGDYLGTERRAGPALDAALEHPQEGERAHAQPQRREAQGQRPARQPDRDRRRRGVARGRHGPGALRRRRLRAVREGPVRVGAAPRRDALPLRRGRGPRRQAGHAPAAAPRSWRTPCATELQLRVAAGRRQGRRRPSSRTSPTRRRSPARCFAASRPRR